VVQAGLHNHALPVVQPNLTRRPVHASAIQWHSCCLDALLYACTLPATFRAELAAAVSAKDFDSWGTAPACTYKGPGLPDKLGRQWGYQNGQSCAFRQPAAPPQQSWDQAPECTYKLSDINSLTDKAGRRWGFEGGRSCTFKTQILSTVAPRPPPPPPPPQPPGMCKGGLSVSYWSNSTNRVICVPVQLCYLWRDVVIHTRH